jgi:non-homologous end joining protein Ku
MNGERSITAIRRTDVKTTNPALKKVDDEYRDALAEWTKAKKRYAKAGSARSKAHKLEELKRSQMAQRLAGLTDAQWADLRQAVDSPMPFNATVVNGAGEVE